MDLKKEKELWKRGYRLVVGLDEAGRGCLAGPVVATAVTLKNCKPQIPKELRDVNDSKKLTPKKREELYEILISRSLIEWGVGKVGPKVIDKINILEATKLAMKRAIKNLKPDFLILDGRMKLNLKIYQESIVKADEKIFSCATASIIAKVVRDRSMKNYYHKKYPQYGFDKHKGYGTEHHRKMLKKYGPCRIHRRSFKPIKNS